MKFKIIHRHPSERLILLFAGWGMDPHPFENIRRDGYDLAVVWDYRDLSATWIGELDRYVEIAVFAWSFGVPAASAFIAAHSSLPVTARIAVNGTAHPVHDTLGIPTEIFNGTLETLDDRNLVRFYRRMCGGSRSYSEFAKRLPARDTCELRDELKAIASRSATPITWDKVYISTADLVIPPDNQRRAWDGEAYEQVELDGAPHLPDFKYLLDSTLTDKQLVESRFRGAATTYEANATAQRDIADRMLSCVTPCHRILEIGPGTGYATSRLADLGEVEAWDLALTPAVESLAAEGRITARACDAETALRHLPSGSVDLLFSASTVQWFNSLPAFLRETERVLAPGGKALISTFSPLTMAEIHSVIGSTPRFPSTEAIRRMIPSARVTEEELSLCFPSPADALRHVRLTGVNSLGAATSPAATRRLLDGYPLTTDGKARLTYRPVYITLHRPL